MDYSDPSTDTQTVEDVTYDPYSSTTTSADAGMSAGVMVFYLVILVVVIASMWRIFTKAGQAGWKSLIPIYNTYVELQIVGRPTWWLLLFFIPLVNLVVAIIVSIDLAKSFGKSTAFGVVGLVLFSIIGYPMLAFGKDTYKGPAGSTGAPTKPAAA